MNAIIGLILLFLLLGAIRKLARMDAASVARVIRHSGGALGLVGAILLLMRGRVGVAAALAGMAANFAGWKGIGTGFTTSRGFSSGTGTRSGRHTRPGRISVVRSATIEMRLDHDTGMMTGEVLTGQHAGRSFDTFGRLELLAFRTVLLRDDPEGVNLLEAYLDRRFARWREAEESEGQSRSAGGMTRSEAYEVLGLSVGAEAEEIVRAHRTLMKKFHPDHGGSTALAARVNQAKDVLMQRHG
jgi:hypothetical protein